MHILCVCVYAYIFNRYSYLILITNTTLSLNYANKLRPHADLLVLELEMKHQYASS